MVAKKNLSMISERFVFLILLMYQSKVNIPTTKVQMKKLNPFLLLLSLLLAHGAAAQRYTGRSTAQLILDGQGQSYQYKSDAITFYLDNDSKTINFYCKPYTFVTNEPESENKTLLINTLSMNSDKAGIMELKAQLPVSFKMPTAGKQAKANVTGQMLVAGVSKQIQVPLLVKADAKGNYTYSLDATLDLAMMGAELSADVKQKTNGIVRLSFSDIAIHAVKYHNK